MAAPSAFVSRYRDGITKATEALENMRALGLQYTALGGQAFVHAFWLNPDGTPRAGSETDITEAEFVAGLTAANQLTALLVGSAFANLMKLRT